MLANADLMDFDDDDDYEYNHLQTNNDQFNDYKLSSKNSFANQSDLVHYGPKTGNSGVVNTGASAGSKNRQADLDAEDQFLDEIIGRSSHNKNNKAPPAVGF